MALKKGVAAITLLAVLALGAILVFRSSPAAPAATPEPAVTTPPISPADTPGPAPVPAAVPEPASSPLPEPVPPSSPEPDPLAEEILPARESWILSFAGDCTIGTLHEWQGQAASNNMLSVMGEDMTYPFSNVAELFAADDLTMVNLEGALTDATAAKAKDYRFRAPPRYAEVLSAGGIEAVTLANNHSGDYLVPGETDTRAALDQAGIRWTDTVTPLILTLPDGPRLGIVSFNAVEIDLPVGDVEGYLRRMAPALDACREECDILIAFLHWGWEYRSEPESWMVTFAHALADEGCDLIVGSHPHILQPMEIYGDVPVFYSLGDFCFGGHSNPEDKDTVIVQQEIVSDGAGGFRLGNGTLIPCSISSVTERNDFRPTPCEPGSAAFSRILQKLGRDAPQYSATDTSF